MPALINITSLLVGAFVYVRCWQMFKHMAG